MDPLRTERLSLTPISQEDEEAIAHFHADRRVTALLLDTAPSTPELARTFVAWSLFLNTNGLGVFAARRHGDNKLLGLFTLTPFGGKGEVELGGKLAPAAWGRDLALEAGAALIAHAFTTLHLPGLVSAFHPDNRAVPVVLRRLGFEAAGQADVFGRSAPVMRLSARRWSDQGARPMPHVRTAKNGRSPGPGA